MGMSLSGCDVIGFTLIFEVVYFSGKQTDRVTDPYPGRLE